MLALRPLRPRNAVAKRGLGKDEFACLTASALGWPNAVSGARAPARKPQGRQYLARQRSLQSFGSLAVRRAREAKPLPPDRKAGVLVSAWHCFWASRRASRRQAQFERPGPTTPQSAPRRAARAPQAGPLAAALQRGPCCIFGRTPLVSSTKESFSEGSSGRNWSRSHPHRASVALALGAPPGARHSLRDTTSYPTRAIGPTGPALCGRRLKDGRSMGTSPRPSYTSSTAVLRRRPPRAFGAENGRSPNLGSDLPRLSSCVARKGAPLVSEWASSCISLLLDGAACELPPCMAAVEGPISDAPC